MRHCQRCFLPDRSPQRRVAWSPWRFAVPARCSPPGPRVGDTRIHRTGLAKPRLGRPGDIQPHAGRSPRGIAVKARHSALSANDSFCLVAARSQRGILLTGDALLRRVATESGLRVHGVLWVIDQLQTAEDCLTSLLIGALRAWRSDAAVFLPAVEIENRLRHLEAL